MNDTRFNRRHFLGLAAGAAAGMALQGCATVPERARKRPPNFVLIFTDDQGYNDLSCFGSPKIDTPRIDQMAAEGMRFTDFYVAAPVCSASRAALMTGCYPARVNIPGVLFPGMRTGLNLEERTIAEILKQQGYATACIGKWHLGHLPEFLPMHQGFDYFYGIPYSNDMTPTPLMRNDEVLEEPAEQDTLTERYTAEAIKFIKDNKDQPFFVYLPHSMPHVPLHTSDRFRGTSERGLYGDVIETIDWGVGQILDTLKELALDEDTLVVFTSDNGPWLIMGDHGGSAAPLRAGKGTTFEGGMREPTVMWWPGTIPAGTECSEVASTMDLLPTFAHLAGGAPPKDRIIDGKDIRPLICGEPNARSPHKAFFYYSGFNLQAVRSGKWKLHFPALRSKSEETGNPKDKEGIHYPLALYNLEEDIGERNNVAAQHPNIVKRLTRYAKSIRKDIGDHQLHMKGKNRRPPGVPRKK